MTAERIMRYLIHEAGRVRQVAYAAGNGAGPDAFTLESFLLLLPSMGKLLDLPAMDDAEANAVRFQLNQELIGKNAHQQAA